MNERSNKGGDDMMGKNRISRDLRYLQQWETIITPRTKKSIVKKLLMESHGRHSPAEPLAGKGHNYCPRCGIEQDRSREEIP